MAIRVLHTLTVAPWPPGFFNDEALYRTLADLLSRGEGYVRPGEFFDSGLALPTAERPPLYPFALAGLMELGLDGPDSLRLLGALTGGVTIAALGLLARRLAGARAGLIAAGIAALYPTLIAADGALMTESLYGMLVALALLIAQRLLDEPRAAPALGLGALLGLAALTRGEALLLLALLLVPLLRRPGGLRTAAVTVLAFVVVMAPWTVRNWNAFDRPVLVATEGGQTLAGANCEPVYNGPRIGSWEVSCFRHSELRNEAVASNRASGDAFEYALDHVERLPLVAGARVLRTWGVFWPGQIPEGRSEWVTWLGVALYVLLLPLAIYGIVVLRRRGAPLAVIVSPLVVVTLTSLVSYGSVRFRHTAELALVVLAAVALDALWRARRPVEST